MSSNGRGRRREPGAEPPPGQSLVEDFPVLSAGPSGVGCPTGTTPDTIEQMASDASVSTRHG